MQSTTKTTELTINDSFVIVQIPCLIDNYAFLIHCLRTKQTCALDTPELNPILSELLRRRWTLTHILNTHWHGDHTGANLQLKERFPRCEIVGPRNERAKIPGQEKIPGIDRKVEDGDEVVVGNITFKVIDVKGHTLGHCAYYSEEALRSAFVGDCVFAMGCGRVFEGTKEMMFESVSKIQGLPDETKLYCAHEYTMSNVKFAKTVDGKNLDLIEREKKCEALRRENEPTVPTTVAEEKKTNPFMRANDATIREFLGMQKNTDSEVFAEIRTRKDNF